MDTVFKKTDILLPYYASDSDEWETWSVIACDQLTSEPSYWDDTKRNTKGAPSTLDLILPEAFLGTELEGEIKKNINACLSTSACSRSSLSLLLTVFSSKALLRKDAN